ncbi:lipopolysaccharide assembly protein LapB [Methylotenera sp.]|uniref:tetratricopeptide repeat protein n=1 Tax=Methylotenera sp. TaxID=2051956 RepID=UPI00248763F6|nr:tetratricopeptide repeat protein [Methylotenera sp.]MDI1300270.1 tetratricopeptide repeat protein [Methylotenera sp.]
MKLQITLSSIFIILFLNNVYAASPEAIACKTALDKGDAVVALKQAEKALINNNKETEAYICQGRALMVTTKFDSALSSFKQANTLSTDAFDKTIATLLMGRSYHALKQDDLAITSFQQMLENAKAANNQAFERVAHNELGDVYFESKQYAQALPEYMAATKLAANDNERGESYEKVASTHHKLNQNDLAVEYQLKAYLMHDTAGTLDQYAHSSVELGRYYVVTKNYPSAENILNKIIKFAKEQGGAYYEAQGSYVLAQVKAAKGDIATAKRLVENAKYIAKNTNDKALDAEIDQETAGLF